VINVLAMDGGGSLCLFSLSALQKIVAARPGFLHAVDIFAGTSAGGINALVMAASDSREAGVARCVELWSDNPFDSSLPRLAASALGCVSVYSNSGFVDALGPLLGDLTLGGLAARGGRVVIPSFELMGESADGPRWRPRVFHNLEGASEEDLATPLLDLALRTSASPVFLPIHQGFVDGGLFANNPSMCALTRILGGREQGALRAAGARGAGAPPAIHLLSVGTGLRGSHLDAYDQPWGWQQWLFDLRRPLALMQIFLEAGEEEISQQCSVMLGEGFYRLNPPMTLGDEDDKPADLTLRDAFPSRTDPRSKPLMTLLQQASGLGATAPPPWLVAALAWLGRVNWPPRPPAAAAGSGRRGGGGRPAARKRKR
jgi:hypothetical protein